MATTKFQCFQEMLGYFSDCFKGFKVMKPELENLTRKEKLNFELRFVLPHWIPTLSCMRAKTPIEQQPFIFLTCKV